MLRRAFLYLSQQKKFQQAMLRFHSTRTLASRFVAGDSLAEAVQAAAVLNSSGILCTLDQLGEHVHDTAGAAAARDAYIETISAIAQSRIQSGVSVKLTQLGMDFSVQECAANLRAVVEYAAKTGHFVRVDMEGSDYTERTLEMVSALRQNGLPVGAVIQAYLFRSEDDVRALAGQGVSIRLCKGAYNEPASVAFPQKADVDRNYIRLMQMLLLSGGYHAIATHDPAIIEQTCLFAEQQHLAKNAFEFQMLYGIRPDLQQRLVRNGYRMRVYVPFGREWFSYFMRRLAERPANALFLLKNLLR